MKPHLKKILNQLRQELEKLYSTRLRRMVLFGSQAREDAPAGADLDILVVLAGKVNPGEEIQKSGEIISEISLENQLVVSCLFMEEERFLHQQGPLLRNIRKEGVITYEPGPKRTAAKSPLQPGSRSTAA